jgi:hypothetical protein
MATTFRGCVVHISYKKICIWLCGHALSLAGVAKGIVFSRSKRGSCCISHHPFARKIDSNEICLRVRLLEGSYTFSRHISFTQRTRSCANVMLGQSCHVVSSLWRLQSRFWGVSLLSPVIDGPCVVASTYGLSVLTLVSRLLISIDQFAQNMQRVRE